MTLFHTIEAAYVGDGVYRHPFRSKERSRLVRISWKFGGIGPADVGRRVYESSSGKLVWEGSHPNAPVTTSERIKR